MHAPRIMIIAGEASGDMHGAKLAQALRRRCGDVELFGVCSNAMKEQGVRQLVDAKTLSVVGITEVFAKLPVIYRAMKTIKQTLRDMAPDLLILIDFPDLNFRVAEYAKKIGIPILYYISPQIWAWRQGRVRTLKRLVDHMAVILPFEAMFYRRHKVPVTFVGHPLLDRIPMIADPQAVGDIDGPPVIGLLPGSRQKEVATLLPVMLEAAALIRKKRPETRFLVSCSQSVDRDLVSAVSDPYMKALNLTIVPGPVDRVFEQSRLLLAASGTVTLEAALHGIPTVIIYKVSPLSYAIGKRLIKVKYIGIANLIAGKQLQPELIQEDASPENIARTVRSMIDDPALLQRMSDDLLDVRKRLGKPGASDRLASIALSLV
ncbi:MAG: lipid-A-disaccharide synthase [Deltaproteobacteria bacterium]|nr:MAG: lipid-A-disaccharide synthase [Deltaproteobacteria bacterium]